MVMLFDNIYLLVLVLNDENDDQNNILMNQNDDYDDSVDNLINNNYILMDDHILMDDFVHVLYLIVFYYELHVQYVILYHVVGLIPICIQIIDNY